MPSKKLKGLVKAKSLKRKSSKRKSLKRSKSKKKKKKLKKPSASSVNEITDEERYWRPACTCYDNRANPNYDRTTCPVHGSRGWEYCEPEKLPPPEEIVDTAVARVEEHQQIDFSEAIGISEAERTVITLQKCRRMLNQYTELIARHEGEALPEGFAEIFCRRATLNACLGRWNSCIEDAEMA